MPPEDDIAKNPNISLKTSLIILIDKYRVGHGYNNRSDYITKLIIKDLQTTRMDIIAELMSMIILPMMFFGFFMICAVLTKGTLFFLFMGISGIFAIAFSLVYWKKHKADKII